MIEKFSYTTAKFIFDPKEEWNARIKMIRDTKEFLYYSCYFFHYDSYGQLFAKQLLKCRERGVEITFLVDSFGQMLCQNLMTEEEKKGALECFDEMRNAGIRLIFKQPTSIFQKYLGSGQHVKFQLNETGKAIIGSGSISSTCFNKWREFACVITGEIVQRMLKEFDHLGVEVPHKHEVKIYSVTNKLRSKGRMGYISHDPSLDPHPLNPICLKNRNKLTDYLVEQIDNAETSICLSTYFYKPAPAINDALINAAKRGVRVEIFHSHRKTLGPVTFPWYPCLIRYKKLLKAGVVIRENSRGDHTKIYLIDNKKIIFGTYNTEYAAHDRIAEVMLVNEEPTLVKVIIDKYKELRASKENSIIDMDFIKKLPFKIRLQAFLVKPIHRWL